MGIEALTFGCRLNIGESEAMKRHAAAAGADDLIIVNTCAVTAEATRQARQAVRRIARERPGARVVVTGCAAQIEPQTFASLPGVAAVLGNAEKLRPESWGALPEAGEAVAVRAGDIMAERQAPEALAPERRFEGHTRAFLQIQNGCDHRCTFCIIPFGRGNSRSVPAAQVIADTRRLVDAGHAEIVMTGVDITSWGADLEGMPRLGSLIRRLLREVPDLQRLRLSSIDSIEADPDLMAALADEPRFMPHLHLSLQAGDDMILKRMKRRHSRTDAIRFCAEARALRPGIAFSADIIAGFPTETEDMFARSLDLIAECGLSRVHVFPFSPRPGTPAARMPQLPREIVKERAARLRAHAQQAWQAHLDSETGARRLVLAERGGTGRTEAFTPVRLDNAPPPGTFLDVRIAGNDGEALIAA